MKASKVVGAYLVAVGAGQLFCLAFFLLCDAARGSLVARVALLVVAALSCAFVAWASVSTEQERLRKKGTVSGALDDLKAAGERVAAARTHAGSR